MCSRKQACAETPLGAGLVLVPPDALLKAMNQTNVVYRKKVSAHFGGAKKMNGQIYKDLLCDAVAKQFDVSAQTLKIRVENDGVWKDLTIP